VKVTDTLARPEWWDKTYSRSAKGIDAAVFGNLMDPVPWQELYHNLMHTPESAPGYDGLDNRALRALVRPLSVVALEKLKPKELTTAMSPLSQQR
jgi:hypothetical protein